MSHARRRAQGVAELQAGSLSAFAPDIVPANRDDDENHADTALAVLIAALTHPDASRRILALDASCELLGTRAEALVIGMFTDTDATVRRAAVLAATRIAAPRLVSCLIVALGDPDVSVRSASRQALQAITKKRIDLLDASDGASSERQRRELRAWWKRYRMSQLLEELA